MARPRKPRPNLVALSEKVAPPDEIEALIAEELERPPEPEPSILEGFDEPTEADLAARPDDGIPAFDANLTPDEKKIFLDTLKAKLPIEKLAERLEYLSSLKSQKTAGVGLRACQEVLALYSITGDKATEAPAMFALPSGTTVSVQVKRVDK